MMKYLFHFDPFAYLDSSLYSDWKTEFAYFFTVISCSSAWLFCSFYSPVSL